MRKFNLRNLVAIAVYTVLVAVFVSCDCKNEKELSNDYKTVDSIKTDTLNVKHKDGIGVGITTSGKVGIELMDNVYMTTDGEIGFGF